MATQRAEGETEAAMRHRAVRVDVDRGLVRVDRLLVLAEMSPRLAEMEERGLHARVALDRLLEGSSRVVVLAVLEVVKAERVVDTRHLGLKHHRVAQGLGRFFRASERPVRLTEVRV